MTINKLLTATSASSDEVAELPADIRRLIDDAEEILVMSPELPSRLEWLVSDTDKTREKTDQRMREVMDEVNDSDTHVKGRVGANDPLLAFDEAVAEFEPSHILVVMRPDDRSGWQESGLIDSLNGRFDLSITSYQVT